MLRTRNASFQRSLLRKANLLTAESSIVITQALVSNGARVYITGRREEALNSVVDQYNTGPGEVIA